MCGLSLCFRICFGDTLHTFTYYYGILLHLSCMAAAKCSGTAATYDVLLSIWKQLLLEYCADHPYVVVSVRTSIFRAEQCLITLCSVRYGMYVDESSDWQQCWRVSWRW